MNTKLNVQRITKVLAASKASAWKVSYREEETTSLHATRRNVETVITGERAQADVTVYKAYGKELGDAHFTLYTDDEATVGSLVEEALAVCTTARKPRYPLPKPSDQSYARKQKGDARVVKAFAEGKTGRLVARVWKDGLQGVAKVGGVSVNSSEARVTLARERVVNSAGVDVQQAKTECFYEVFLTATKGRGKAKEEQEFMASKRTVRYADVKARAFVQVRARMAHDVLAAERFKKVQGANIVLTGDALAEFWMPHLGLNPVVMHANAQLKYRGLSRYALGEAITLNKAVTLTTNPFLDGSVAASTFDQDGVASQSVMLVEQGVVKVFFASQRFAHYLHVQPTGSLGAIELAAGTTARNKLFVEGTVEIVSFSSFVPNELSGDFSAEVRLAYVHTKGRRVPIKHVMFSGNVFAMLGSLRTSKDVVQHEGYHGPSVVRFDEGARVAGF